MSIMTLWYSFLFVAMMVIGGLCYEQPHFVKKHEKKYETLAQVGWILIVAAMIGLIHGILGIFHLILL